MVVSLLFAGMREWQHRGAASGPELPWQACCWRLLCSRGRVRFLEVGYATSLGLRIRVRWVCESADRPWVWRLTSVDLGMWIVA